MRASHARGNVMFVKSLAKKKKRPNRRPTGEQTSTICKALTRFLSFVSLKNASTQYEIATARPISAL